MIGQRIEAYENAVGFDEMNAVRFNESVNFTFGRVHENGGDLRCTHLAHALANGAKALEPLGPTTVSDGLIQLDLDRLKINRNDFMEALREKKIGTSVHFIPLHLHPYYRDNFGYKPGDFPVASAVYARIVSLPIFPKMSDHDIDRVIDAVRATVKRYRR